MEWLMQYGLQLLSGVITGLLGGLYARACQQIKVQRAQADAMRRGVQALLRDRIVQMYHRYTDQGWCPIYARENMEQLHEEYVNLGGNGTVRDLVDDVYNLPKSE